MRILVAAIAASLSTVSANAAVVRYDFTTKPLLCSAGNSFDCPEGTFVDVWEGSLTFDESLLPGKSLNAANITLSWKLPDNEINGFLEHEFNNLDLAGAFSGSRDYSAPHDWSVVGLINYTGLFGEQIGSTVDEGGYGLSFDADGMPVYWYGWNRQGGSNDPFTNLGGDGNDEFRSGEAGTWVRTVIAPSPVPLPASLPLLIVSCFGLAWISRKRTTGIRRNL